LAGFLLLWRQTKGGHMSTPAQQLREFVRLIADDDFTVSILVVVVVGCFFAFGLGAPDDLVGGILVLGLVTAVVEAWMRAGNRK